MDDVVNLNVVRSYEDNRLCSVEEILEDTLKISKEEDFTKCVLLLYSEDDERYQVWTRYSGCTALEAKGILFSAIKDEILK